MNIKFKNRLKRILSSVIVVGMAMSLIPSVSFAAQSNEYVDPADVWIEANGRTSEFDINATVTTGTLFCPICDMPTTNISYRVPEYTRTGETALNRGVYYSDGTCSDGVSKGNLDDGTPGVDAFYTGYHWTKSVCQNCGTINSVDGVNAYSCGKDVYSLNPCDSNFFLDFDNTSYTPYNIKTHTTAAKKGKYCQFCKGTYTRTTTKQENHDFTEIIDGELGNQRFHITADCNDCGYKKNEYAAAKSVVQSYYGKVDGKAHTVTVSDLSENGVHTSIHYGAEANKCNKTSAPSYTEEGYYPVYYEIDYSYGSESMTENGVSYVWLLSDTPTSNTNGVHSHDYRYLETVRPTCIELGYDRFQCSECGALQKTNYTPSTGHDYNTVVIREASCQQDGLELHACKSCGSYYTENTSMTYHKYQTNTVATTCTVNGYTEHICINCGFKYISDLTPIAKHDYRPTITAPTCKSKGFTTYKCRNCDDTYISDYTEPSGHQWDEGHIITNSTCESDGVMEYDCKQCDEKMIKAVSANGHTPGAAATCTELQICESCNAILELPKGHSYSQAITNPTCTTMGYTTYSCENCDNSYISNYIDKTAHNYNLTVTAPTCTAMGYTTYTCADCGNSYVSDYTDKSAHNYVADVTVPTCTELGYTTYTCTKCSETHKSDYIEATGHKLSDWIIDTPATIEHSGTKHVECVICGTVINTVEIPKLPNNDNSDEDGHSRVGDYNILITDKDNKPIFNSEISIDTNDNLTIKLPEGRLLSAEDITTITVTYTETQQPVTDIDIFIADSSNNTATGKTDENGQLTVPNANSSTGNTNGTVADNNKTYVVIATDKNGELIPNCDVVVGHNDSIDVKLPSNTAFNKDNRVTITVVTEKGKAVSGLGVQVIGDNNIIESGYTNINGQLTLPIFNTDITDPNGYAQVIEGEKIYNVIVEDTKAKIENAIVKIKDGKISVTLPDGQILEASNQTTVTVSDKDAQPVKDMSVTVTDKNAKTATKITDGNGKITVPVKTSTGSGGRYVKSIYTVKVVDKDGKTVNVNKTIKDNKITLTLPNGNTLDDNYYTITVTDNKGKVAPNIDVTLQDKTNSVNGKTDTNGQVSMPLSEHKAYIVGYPDGTFLPDRNMTRAEAAAIFARNIADRKGENISNGKSSFTDVNTKLWYNNSIAYLKKYNIISGYTDGTFRPEEQITRAEFVTMCMRFYDMLDDITVSDKNIFNDVPKSHWAAVYICNAIAMKWIEGYADGTFKPDSNITRAEVVAIVNRVLDHTGDTEYVNKNISAVNKFMDLKDKSYWAFYEILEAANTHMAVESADGETWVK